MVHRYKLERELNSGPTLAEGGYYWWVEGQSASGEVIARSRLEGFQIPPLGPPWESIKNNRQQVCTSWCSPDNPNEFWHFYDDLIYHNAERLSLPPSLLKAVMMVETGTGIAPRLFDGHLIPPHRAYLYEPGWDYNLHYGSRLYARPGPQVDRYRLPGNTPDRDVCDLEEFEPCPYPYDRPIPGSPIIYEFAWSNSLGFSFSNVYGRGTPLTALPGCQDPEEPSGCVANGAGVVAQYRIVASYNVGQTVYAFAFNEIVPPDGIASPIPPEQLYDPALGVEQLAEGLSGKRCIVSPGLTAADTDLDSWRRVLLAYNGGLNQLYDDGVVARATYVQPHSLVRGATPAVGESEVDPCSRMSTSGVDADGRVALLSLEDQLGSRVLASGWIDLGGNIGQVWVALLVESDDGGPSQNGRIAIYADETAQELVWESEPIDGAGDIAMVRQGDLGGFPALFVEWFTGPHATRSYVVLWNGGVFLRSAVFAVGGEAVDGIGSDGGGSYMFPDGSVLAFRRTYNAADQRLGVIFEPDGTDFREARSFLADAQVEDTSPPQTALSASPAPNESGWAIGPVEVTLQAIDDNAVFLISYRVEGMRIQKDVVTLLNPVGLTLDEGRWVVRYGARDAYGNVEEELTEELRVDGTPPTSEAHLEGVARAGGGFGSPVVVSLDAADPDLADGSPGSGLAGMEYSLDGGATLLSYRGPFTVGGTGTHEVLHRAADLAGNVEGIRRISFEIVADELPPRLTVSAHPDRLWPPNGRPVPVTVVIDAADQESGLRLLAITVEDEYDQHEPVFEPMVLDGESTAHFEIMVELVAARAGWDDNGRIYRIHVVLSDVAGNSTEATVAVLVPHDQGRKLDKL